MEAFEQRQVSEDYYRVICEIYGIVLVLSIQCLAYVDIEEFEDLCTNPCYTQVFEGRDFIAWERVRQENNSKYLNNYLGGRVDAP